MNLKDEIVALIRRRGPISFAEYMDLALYHPQRGFFSNSPVGERGHFVTSVHVSPVFASLLAVQVRETWDVLGRPPDFTVVDVGASDGTLLAGICSQLSDLPVRAVAVEVSQEARAIAAERGFETCPAIEQVGAFVGCVIANEFLDNLPFRRLRERDGRTVEVAVGVDGDRLIEVERDCPGEPARGRAREWTSSTAIAEVVASIAERVQRGYVFLLDYGFVDGEDPEPVRGYRAQRLVDDLLARPGENDITGPVDFSAVADAARAAGLQAWGPVTQRHALMALGYGPMLAALRRRQAQLEEVGRWRGAVETFGARTQASMLVDPAGLGAHRLVALATSGLPRPRAVVAK